MHQIGAGSVGPVFRGEDGETRDPVVIKVIRVGLTPERVAIVGAALTALKDRLPSHPALAPLIDTGVVDLEPYVVSPFIDGDSLDVALREYGPANMGDALPRLRHLADAMDAAAAAGAAHGSLHLRDIVVSVDETVLTGMGIASVLERVGVRPPVRRPYCAPEVALGLGISPAADQYALAAIAHEWLTGRRLSGSGAAGFQVPASSDAGADALHAVFARAMDESPEARFPTATAFVEAVAEQAGHATPRARAGRRAPVIDAPRLSFDETPDEPAAAAAMAEDDAVAPADGAAAAGDPLDAPLHGDAVPPRITWDARDAAPPPAAPVLAFDDDASEDPPPGRPGGTWERPARTGTFEPDVVETDASGSSWKSWAALLVFVTLSALAGGWALLRWGTPSSGPVAVTPAPESDAARPGAEPASPVPEQVPAPAAPPASAAPASPPAPRITPAPVSPPASRATPAPAPKKTPPAQPSRPAGSTAPRRAPQARPPTPPRAATPPPAATTGRVLVRSTPSGAEVFVNGERRGVTPLALRDLAFGAYAVRVVRAGFVPVEQRVAIDAGRPARSVEVALTRASAAAPGAPAASPAVAPAPGSLLVESRPAGARVTIDGVDVGVTPLTLPSVAVGTRTVRIERPGYVPITTTARVEARTRARVAVTLTAERPR